MTNTVRDALEVGQLRPSWMDHAACRGQGFDAWFAADELGEEADNARWVCCGCPVRPECLGYALAAGIRHGVWGGFTAKERAEFRRRQRRRPGVGDAGLRSVPRH